jgi:hypothetical protein
MVGAGIEKISLSLYWSGFEDFFVEDIPPKLPPDLACYLATSQALGNPFVYAMLAPWPEIAR